MEAAMKKGLGLTLALAGLLNTACASAGLPHRSSRLANLEWTRVIQIEPNTEICVRLMNGKEIDGYLTSADQDGVLIDMDGTPRTIGRGSVRRVALAEDGGSFVPGFLTQLLMLKLLGPQALLMQMALASRMDSGTVVYELPDAPRHSAPARPRPGPYVNPFPPRLPGVGRHY
jgi:hypothetical protein